MNQEPLAPSLTTSAALPVGGYDSVAAPPPSSLRVPLRAPWHQLLAGVCAPAALHAALAEHPEAPEAADFLVTSQRAQPLAVLHALARGYGCGFALLECCTPKPGMLALVPQDLVRRFGVLPLFALGGDLYVAMPNPDDLDAQDYLRRVTQRDIIPVLVLRSGLDQAVRRLYTARGVVEQAFGELAGSQRAASAAASLADAGMRQVDNEDAPVIKLTHYVLSHAISLGASDIHLEPQAGDSRLRCRVDGQLHDLPELPSAMHRAVISRLKIMAGLDIAERRLPQDGRLQLELAEGRYDLRVSIIPGLHGESAVLRVLDSSGARRDLADLGLEPGMRARWETMIAQPHGLILVTGPTGSGKSTTLYTTLAHIATPRRKFITLEDPVEYQMASVLQLQVHPAIGFGFAEGLRSILRHDPDVIMLGEIRDTESAEIALRASLTGHLLFSTLHTNSAPHAVTRLVDMGLPTFLVQSSLTGVLAQRLLRRLCTQCRQPATLTSRQLDSLRLPPVPAQSTLYEPVGCPACAHFGYRGRVAVYELLEWTSELRRLSLDQLQPEALAAAARTQGYVPLREMAIQALLAGQTSLEELATLGLEAGPR
jgi:type IV pilus assembly protein PilB